MHQINHIKRICAVVCADGECGAHVVGGEQVEGEIETIEQLMANTGQADWRAYFRREVDPRAGLED